MSKHNIYVYDKEIFPEIYLFSWVIGRISYRLKNGSESAIVKKSSMLSL